MLGSYQKVLTSKPSIPRQPTGVNIRFRGAFFKARPGGEMRKTFFFMLLILQGFSGILRGQERFGFEIGGYAARANWQGRRFLLGPPQVRPPFSLGINSVGFDYDDKNA